MGKHKVTGTKPENNTKADLVPIKLFYDTLAQVQDRANSLANPEYDDGCQAFLVYLEHFLYICERYPNTAAARIYKLKRKELGISDKKRPETACIPFIYTGNEPLKSLE